jgi:GT2 family glycosyltransferase
VKETVAAVLVTYNRREQLERAIYSLLAQTRQPDRIVVVDNGSTDGTSDRLAAFTSAVEADVEAEVVRLAENTGPAGGYAAGLANVHDRGEAWAFLMGDDDVVAPSALECLLDQSRREPADPPPFVGCSRAVGHERRYAGAWWRGRAVLAADHPPATPVYEVDVTTFPGLLVPTQALLDIGLPDPDFFMMWEEYEFCLRAREAGYRIVIIDEPLVTTPPGGPAHYPPWRGYYDARSSLTVALRRRHPVELFWWAIRQTKFAIAALTLDRPARRVWMRCRGVVDALRGRTGRTVEPT